MFCVKLLSLQIFHLSFSQEEEEQKAKVINTQCIVHFKILIIYVLSCGYLTVGRQAQGFSPFHQEVLP